MKCCLCQNDVQKNIFTLKSEKIFPKEQNKKIRFCVCDDCFGEIILKLIGKYPPDNYILE